MALQQLEGKVHWNEMVVKVHWNEMEGKVVEVHWKMEHALLQILQWWHRAQAHPLFGNTFALFLWPVHSYQCH